jgi:hypothetical protein
MIIFLSISSAQANRDHDEQHGAADLVKPCEKIVQQRATTKEMAKNFRTENPDMSVLCDAYFDRNSDIQFITKKNLANKSDQFAGLNPLILAVSKLPPFSEHLIAPTMSSSYLAMTYPNLEPSYPTLEKRPPKYLLPALARNDSASLQLCNGYLDGSDKKARLNATEAIMLLTIVRSYADKLRSVYGNYLMCSSQFACDFRHHQIQPLTSLSVHESAKEFLKQRESLVDFCGEKAVTDVDARNNFSELVKQASKLLR